MSKKVVSNRNEIVEFYKKRLTRFEIPLFISCLLLVVIGRYLSIYQVFTTCLGVAGIIPLTFPKTLWYFSMIILFYLLTPFVLLVKRKNIYKSFVLCVVIYLILLIGSVYLWFDKRLPEYFPFYFIPLILPKQVDLFLIFKKKWHYALTISLAFFCIWYVQNMNNMDLGYYIILSNSMVCFIIISLSTLLQSVKLLSKLLCTISFASMFAYLFHREIYILSTYAIGRYSYITAAIFVSILFVVSYLLQYCYNKCSRYIFNNK